MAADAPLETRPLGDDVPAAAFLQSAPLCKAISAESFARLLSHGTLVSYATGAVVVTEGDLDDALYIVFDGSVAVCKSHDAELVELATLERGHIFGEIGVMMQAPRSASVVTGTDSRLIRLPGDIVRAVADAEPMFGRLLAALMAAHRKDTARKIG